jgi:uncharacterized peroxidase-related enzyme
MVVSNKKRDMLMGAWIKMVSDEEATEGLKKVFEKVRTPSGTIDNVMRVHSLRPHTMEGHLALYKSVLHNPDNVLELWFLEVVASFTSILNQCDYSLAHHFMNVRRLLDDQKRADNIFEALKNRQLEGQFQGKELALLIYVEKLTLNINEMKEVDIQALRAAGCDDGEILEVNQVCAYFNYSNRLLNGLGVTTAGDIIGYYN